ncbi:cardiolipin synthase [Demequina sediminicola]|uniref:cardiolipin synthase n=1 Tax=Demequina sediminicola TaxID=1095026 RepID=UPI000784FF59|nr:cardiolipin synthase [Demequina sediminicola]
MTFNPAVVYAAISWVLVITALIYIPRRRRPSSGTAWILLIVLLPIPGWLAFVVFGNYKLPKNRRDIQARINATIDEQIEQAKQESSVAFIDPEVKTQFHSVKLLAQEYGRLPAVAANSLDVLTDYNGAIETIVRDIEAARKTVFIEYYAMTLDDTTQPLFDALVAAKARGVDVRVMYDTWGSKKYPGKKPMLASLDDAGIAYEAILPLHPPGKSYVRPDLRNHRKIVVIDNAIGYTGSQNMIDRAYHRKDDIYYDELVVRMTGPVVLELGTLFMTDWISEGGSLEYRIEAPTDDPYSLPGATMQVLPSGPGFDGENNLKVFTHLLHLARTEITIVNPYFVPSEGLLGAIVAAAKRGVRVRMINSQAMDQWMIGYAQRSYYTTLLEAGVEVYLYNAPKLLHSKYILVDNEVTVVGSSNMDMRSFELNSELSLICYDTAIATEMSQITEMYQERSTRLDYDTWEERSVYKRTLENITRLTSAFQ